MSDNDHQIQHLSNVGSEKSSLLDGTTVRDEERNSAQFRQKDEAAVHAKSSKGKNILIVILIIVIIILCVALGVVVGKKNSTLDGDSSDIATLQATVDDQASQITTLTDTNTSQESTITDQAAQIVTLTDENETLTTTVCLLCV